MPIHFTVRLMKWTPEDEANTPTGYEPLPQAWHEGGPNHVEDLTSNILGETVRILQGSDTKANVRAYFHIGTGTRPESLPGGPDFLGFEAIADFVAGGNNLAQRLYNALSVQAECVAAFDRRPGWATPGELRQKLVDLGVAMPPGP